MTKADKIFIKLAKKNQVRTEDYLKTKTVYKAGDDSPEKKNIVNQVANQITTNDYKMDQIKKDLKGSTVTADTTWTPYGGIDRVRHTVKRDTWLPDLFDLEATAIRDRNQGIVNIYGDDVRVDHNPPVSDLFPKGGLNKKEMIETLKKKGK